MSLIQKLYEAQENKDLEKYNEVVSEDYYWVKPSTGQHGPREELSKNDYLSCEEAIGVVKVFLKELRKNGGNVYRHNAMKKRCQDFTFLIKLQMHKNIHFLMMK